MLKVLDLFSGIGGFSLGLERTGGFETVAFCEIEEISAQGFGEALAERADL
jgi:site-specific DNA-cytosine methylase